MGIQEADYDNCDFDEDRVDCSCCGKEIEDLNINYCPNCHEPTCRDCCEGLSDMFYGYCTRCF